MTRYHGVLYEDNAGGLHMFALDDRDNVVWGSHYFGDTCYGPAEALAARDWSELVSPGGDCEGLEPPEWASTLGDLGAIVDDYLACRSDPSYNLIATTAIPTSEYPGGIYRDACGAAGSLFARAYLCDSEDD